MIKNKINRLVEYARKKEGFLLSTEYIGIAVKYKWMCKEGHKFERTFRSMYCRNVFCHICYIKKKNKNKPLKTIKKITENTNFSKRTLSYNQRTKNIISFIELCKKHNYIVINPEKYEGIETMLYFMCGKGHIFRKTKRDAQLWLRKSPEKLCEYCERVKYNKNYEYKHPTWVINEIIEKIKNKNEKTDN